MFLLLVYLGVALGFSFLCSIAEAVLLSVTPSYIATLETQSKARARRAGLLLAQLKENIDRPLAAILSLNTIAHTVGAAGVGAQATQIWGSAYVGVTSAVLTLLVLVLSEIIPKTLGANYWRILAPSMAYTVRLLIVVLYPLVLMCESITRMLSSEQGSPTVTRAEFAALASLGEEEGHLEEKESRILRNVLLLRGLKVGDIMTPRTVVLALPETMTLKEAFEQQPEIPVSRIPIYKSTLDDVSGFVLKNEILSAQAKDEWRKSLADFRRDMVIIRENASLSALYELLLTKKQHIALAVDDFGGTAGIVTLEDLIETLLGSEIVDEADKTVDMQQLARSKWKQRAERLGLHEGRIPRPEERNPPSAEETLPPKDA